MHPCTPGQKVVEKLCERSTWVLLISAPASANIYITDAASMLDL